MEWLPENMPKIMKVIIGWGLTHGVKIVLILIGMWITFKISKIASRRLAQYASKKKGTSSGEDERRIQTLVAIFEVVAKTLIAIFGGMIIIKEIGIDIGPILAGAGIIGLAIGFGSQALVKDLVSGFFLIMENQIRVGDVVRIGDCSGLVEQITLRTVILRDVEGTVHTIPNGDVSTISNMTFGWSRAKLDISVAYKENIDDVIKVLEELGRQMQDDQNFKSVILDKPTILGIDSLGDSGVTITMIVKTLPLKQWDVARELRRRVKNEFDRLGIEMPFPHRTIYIRQDEELTFGVKQK